MSLTPSAMVPLGTKAPDFTLPTTTDGHISLSKVEDSKVLVVAFICNHCPYVKHILPGFIKLVKDYSNKSVAFIAINSNDAQTYPEDSFENMRILAVENEYPFVYAFDEQQKVAKAYGATCTPDFFVFNKDRKLVYRGQMDDARPGNDVTVTGEDLRQAIDFTLDNKELNENQKPSTGCNIKWKNSL